MLKGNPSGGEDGYSSNWPYPCDACHAAASELYCSTDSTYHCRRCDLHFHAATPMAFHERVWVDNAPAAFTCRAYSDEIEIPSANLLVPMTPPSDFLFASSTTHLEADHGIFPGTEHDRTPNKSNEKLQAEADSWLLLDLDNDNQTANSGTTQHGKEVDENLDFLKHNSFGEYQYHLDQTDQLKFSTSHDLNRYSGDRVVTVQPLNAVEEQQQQQQQQISFDRKHEPSKDTLMYATPTSQKVPLSFINPGYLFSATTSNTLNSYSSFLQGTTNLFHNPSLSLPLPFSSMDREASVLRYREKRRLRKYHKKIRYASRKVNAENRQRVKGRFASKKNREFEVDQMFSSEDCEHGIVPSYQAQ